jgi:hypothetical protein
MKWDHYNMTFLTLQIPPRRIDEVFQAGHNSLSKQISEGVTESD